MSFVSELWQDENGMVLSAELVVLGTLGVAAATVGLNAAVNSVNEELQQFSHAMRSLDQSHIVEGFGTCNAWKAGSCYQQPEVEDSIRSLGDDAADDEQSSPQDDDAQQQQPLPSEPETGRERA
jgi:hypothetical protein